MLIQKPNKVFLFSKSPGYFQFLRLEDSFISIFVLLVPIELLVSQFFKLFQNNLNPSVNFLFIIFSYYFIIYYIFDFVFLVFHWGMEEFNLNISLSQNEFNDWELIKKLLFKRKIMIGFWLKKRFLEYADRRKADIIIKEFTKTPKIIQWNNYDNTKYQSRLWCKKASSYILKILKISFFVSQILRNNHLINYDCDVKRLSIKILKILKYFLFNILGKAR